MMIFYSNTVQCHNPEDCNLNENLCQYNDKQTPKGVSLTNSQNILCVLTSQRTMSNLIVV
jgi:hypothetical protein